MMVYYISDDGSSKYHHHISAGHFFQTFAQSIDAIDVTRVTLSRLLNSINAIDVTRCQMSMRLNICRNSERTSKVPPVIFLQKQIELKFV